jgi:hypothetical protein
MQLPTLRERQDLDKFQWLVHLTKKKKKKKEKEKKGLY